MPLCLYSLLVWVLFAKIVVRNQLRSNTVVRFPDRKRIEYIIILTGSDGDPRPSLTRVPGDHTRGGGTPMAAEAAADGQNEQPQTQEAANHTAHDQPDPG